MSVTKEQKTDLKARIAVRNPLQAALQEAYHYFRTVHGTQPDHKDVVKALEEIMQDEHKVGHGGQ